MIRQLVVVAVALGLAATLAASSPHAGKESRTIKALSPEEIEQLRDGQGMGHALAAELNGYPGPKHVLELAQQLELDPSQKSAAMTTFLRMQHEARRLGEEVIRQERELDELFARGSATRDEIERLTTAIAATNGSLRATHLAAHLEMRDLLKPEQIDLYRTLRGYDPAAAHGDATHHRKHH